MSRSEALPDWMNELAESESLELLPGQIEPDLIGRSVGAFANSQGGTIVVGVSKPAQLAGVPDEERFVEELREELSSFLSPALSVSIVPLDVDGKRLLLIDIPHGPDRPYTWKRAIYVRKGTKVQRADGAAISQLLSTPRLPTWGRRAAPGVNENDIDEKECRLTWEKASGLHYKHDLGGRWPGVLGAMQTFNLVDNGQICNGGLVLFGKDPASRLPQTRVRAVAYRDEKGVEIVDNRIFEGHAFRLIDSILDFLRKHLPIESEIPRKRVERSEKLAVPFLALREAVLNAVQHRDYEAFDGGISLIIRPSSVEIWNSGRLPNGMTAVDLKRAHHSRPHNPDIAHVFFVRGFVERIGSGALRILEECRRAGLPEPEWSEDSGGVGITFRLGHASASLNERQRITLRSLKPGETIATADYQERHEVSERQARNDLADLVENGYLVRIGAGRATQYKRSSKEAL